MLHFMYVASSHSCILHLAFSICVSTNTHTHTHTHTCTLSSAVCVCVYVCVCARVCGEPKAVGRISVPHVGQCFPHRLWPVAKGNIDSLRLDDAIPLVIPLSMVGFAGASLGDAFRMWLWVTATSSLFFHIIAFNGAHHHPEIFHEGDAPRYCLFRLIACTDGLNK